MKFAFQIGTLLLVIISFIANRGKTIRAFQLAYERFVGILPMFIIVLIIASFVLGVLSEPIVEQALGSASNRWLAAGIAALAGSVAIMPGFVAYPLGGILRDSGVLYMVISAFTSTLMMVGVLTLPLEQAFLGTKVALVRNAIGLVVALLVALATGLAFGEVFH
ncbi:MAG: hypothetical protein GF398_02870 [Chitinivibrionales bacterium]|nr:hypothetical protein [Chitinivibrionales bacterium]